MKKLLSLLGALAFVFVVTNINAQNSKSKVQVQNFLKDEPISFIENKGQLADEKGKLLPDIKYYGQQGGVNVYMRANRLSFVFTKVTPIPEKADEAQKKMHLPDKFKRPTKANIGTALMDMYFLAANPEPEIVAEGKLEALSHFYGPHIPKEGITDVNSYSKLTYKNIYPNIDLVLDSKENGMEYSFVVHPGGIVADIKIQWNGADKMENLQGGGITFSNQYGKLNQSIPTSFTSEGNIKSSIVVKNNITTFNVDNFDAGQTLTIDPSLTWSTLYGDTNTVGDNVEVAPNGEVVLQGQTYMATGIATSGTFMTSINTYSPSAYIVKFSSTGKRMWGTYFEGPQVKDISISGKGNIFITGWVGWTKNRSGLSTSGVYQEYLDTFYWFQGPLRTDAFLCKFSGAGKRIWGTYFGGHWDDEAYAVATDRFENAYITGQAYSDSFIATSGAFQTVGGGWNSNYQTASAFLTKFDSSGSLIWSTYYGDGNYLNPGSGSGVVCDDTGNVYIIGITSGDTTLYTPGAYKNNSLGTNPTFLAKFSGAGKRLWGTYFSAEYSTSGIAVNRKGELYISGSTGKTVNIASSGAYQTSCAGLLDCYLAKFNTSGKFYWSTYFGGSQFEENTGLAVDEKNNVCISGNTLSNNGISTSNGYQVKKDSLLDGFCARFNGAGKLLWASYYGGNGKDQVEDISMDNSGNIYLAGHNCSTNLTGTKGAFKTNVSWKNPLNSWGTAMLAKFRLSLTPGVINDTSLCSAGSSVSLGATTISGHTFAWTSKPAGFTSTVANPSVSPTVTTTYYLTESDSFESSSDSVRITIDTTCVWPGDANRDKIVNNNDLLNLGLGFSKKGKTRPSASLTWAAQYAPDWVDTFANKVNYKQADCNGDSTINYSDTMAITTNYSLTHLKTYTFNQGNPTDPHLSLVLSKDSAKAGDVVKADIMYGNSSIPASNIYGLAFSVIYPAGLVDTVLADYSTSWLSNNKLSLSKTAASGQLDMAVVRTNQKDTSGFGKLATLYFKLGSSLPKAYTKLNISLAENTQINAKGQYKPVYMQSDSMLVKQTFTGVDVTEYLNNTTVTVMPNPANSELIARFTDKNLRTICILDMTGKEVLHPQNINASELKINTSDLPSGIYLLNVNSASTIIRQKIVIQH